MPHSPCSAGHIRRPKDEGVTGCYMTSQRQCLLPKKDPDSDRHSRLVITRRCLSCLSYRTSRRFPGKQRPYGRAPTHAPSSTCSGNPDQLASKQAKRTTGSIYSHVSTRSTGDGFERVDVAS
eukprot:scaffold1557_cov246-Pinguiococcus_pyrenoidosus.AAC.19